MRDQDGGNPRPAPGRAPWERGSAESSGSHSEGVAVSDLIAKLSLQLRPNF